jgi:hypothetical protein
VNSRVKQSCDATGFAFTNLISLSSEIQLERENTNRGWELLLPPQFFLFLV